MSDFDELAAYWPDLADMPDGVDVFSEYPVTGGTMTNRLLAVETMALALAEQMRDGTHAERKARGLLLALATAIHNDSLDTLVAHLKPWMRAETARLETQPEPSKDDTGAAFTGFTAFEVEA